MEQVQNGVNIDNTNGAPGSENHDPDSDENGGEDELCGPRRLYGDDNCH